MQDSGGRVAAGGVGVMNFGPVNTSIHQLEVRLAVPITHGGREPLDWALSYSCGRDGVFVFQPCEDVSVRVAKQDVAFQIDCTRHIEWSRVRLSPSSLKNS